MRGVTYTELLEGEQGYTSNLVKLYTEAGTTRTPFKFRESVVKLQEHTTKIMNEIVEKRGDMEEFVIGKTFARNRLRRGRRQPFDPSNFNTWKLAGGVDHRWNNTYKEEDYDGMVVLCAVTRELLPVVAEEGNPSNDLFDQQHYSIALEQQLIHHFLFEKNDLRLANQSLSPGKLGTNNAFAGVVYLAFKLDTEE